MTKNRDKIVNRDISEKNRDMIFLPYRPPLPTRDTFVIGSGGTGEG